MAYRETGARFSVDRRYRYTLRRVWDHAEDLCDFLLLNPSSAAEATHDPTSERCERRARRRGFGGLIVTNLFAICATDPAGLRRVADPIGPENDAAILEAARGAGLVLCGWGHHRGRTSKQVKCEGVAPGRHPECQRRTFPDERRAYRRL